MMRIHDDILKCIVFIGIDGERGFVPVGTGFLGGINYKGYNFTMLVTADHVVDMIAGDHLSIRINLIDGGSYLMAIPKCDRISDAPNDIAIFGLPAFFHQNHDMRATPIGRREHAKLWGDLWTQGVGDEVSTVGLYTSHFGQAKSVPIVRIGNIAAMPGEPVRHRNGYSSAYLIETRSIAGLSGSPVFLNLPRVTAIEGRIVALTGDGVGAYVVGIMVGYHLVQSSEDQILVPNEEDADLGPDTDERNTGIAVVIPIERVFSLVEGMEMKRRMDLAVSSADRTRL